MIPANKSIIGKVRRSDFIFKDKVSAQCGRRDSTPHANKKPITICRDGLICTQSRGRTGTALQPLVFETNASTDSAIWAF